MSLPVQTQFAETDRLLHDGDRGRSRVSSKALSRSQQVAGLTTLAAMLLAVVLDNTPARAWYDLVHHLPASVRIGTLAIDKQLILWINDGLMVFFFLLIALELKREIMEGQLSTPKSIAAPAFAALGPDLHRVQPRRRGGHARLGDPHRDGYGARGDGTGVSFEKAKESHGEAGDYSPSGC